MKELTVKELALWTNDHKPFHLIDVREAWEREAAHIGGRHIPLGELIGRRGELPQDAPVVLYCAKGIRSAIAIQRLEALGFNELYNLQGGMSACRASQESLPTFGPL